MPLTNLDVLKLTIEKTTGTTQHLVDAVIEVFGFDLGKKPWKDKTFIQRIRSFKHRPKEPESLPLPLVTK
jgi:hypothetical protein